MITIKNLKKQFGQTTACNIEEFTIHQGDLLGLVGNNGAGKTTLFRMILDLLKPDDGEITLTFDGNSINPANSEDWKKDTGCYVDEGFLIDFLTPEEYFSFLGKITNMDQEAVNNRLSDFERFANGEIFGQKKLIRNLSAGNKQKVGIIAALFNKPKLVILDEPFNFLDPSSQNLLKHLLKDYSETSGATILISSHNLQHTVDISTRIALLEKGHIIRDIDNTNGAATKELNDYFETGA